MSDINLWEVIVAKFDKHEEKMDAMLDKQAEMNIILAKQEISLAEHIKRTNLLEIKLEPVEKHVNTVNVILKIIGAISVAATLVIGILKLVQDIH